MTIWTEEINTNFNYPHIDIFNKYKDGVLMRYEVKAQEGYVMYESDRVNADIGFNPDTEEEFMTTYYYIISGMPLNYNFDNFKWVAIDRNSVDNNYIF